jgi:hypothetical protein
VPERNKRRKGQWNWREQCASQVIANKRSYFFDEKCELFSTVSGEVDWLEDVSD